MDAASRFRTSAKKIWLLRKAYDLFNGIASWKKVGDELRKTAFKLHGGTSWDQDYRCEELAKCLSVSASFESSDISDHLSNIFYHAMESTPRLIVELGVRGGQSTLALLAAAQLCGAKMLSVDIDDCASLSLSARYSSWHFEQCDDIEFGSNRFESWCRANELLPQVDVLFIDTSHRFEHTLSEIEVWTKYLSGNGVMIFHDSNMGEGLYGRMDGSVGIGWDNSRGVIRAIEEYLSASYDEKTFFVEIRNGYLIRHYPNCNGLTVLRRTRHNA